MKAMCKNKKEKSGKNIKENLFRRLYSTKSATVYLLLVSLLLLDSCDAHENHNSLPTSFFTIVQPNVVHKRHKRSLDHTLEENGLHATHLTLTYDVDKKHVIIDLQLNEDLIPKEHFLSYQLNKHGDKKIIKFSKTDVDLCHYHGTIRDNPLSQVAVSTCSGIKGIIFDGDETYYIESPKNGTLKDDHFLYKHSDLNHNGTCGYEGGIHKSHDPDLFRDLEMKKLSRFKRSSTTEGIIRGPYNAKKHSSYVELVIVIDNKLYQNMNEDIKNIHLYCKNIANIINALYVPLNLFISLVGVVIWSENNEVELSSDGDKTLKNFLHYRRKTLVKTHPNDNAQLLTKEHFDGGVVGKALKGPICTYEFSGGVSMDHSPLIGVVATTVAHEMGHNFGMEHDSPDCKCQDDRCIMSPSSSSVAPRHWSSCSIDQLNLAFHHGMNYCLKNKPTKLFESPVCGNNFVEPGEQCDCGLPEFCKDNTCCNAATCMLYSNASCATGECCDLTTCKPKTAGVVCRPADGTCDLPEFCTGSSEFCPDDVFKRDTDTCDDGKAFCYHGVCRSQSDQCKLLWGPTGQSSSDQCYHKNIDGSRHGNCGYDRLKQEYLRCNENDTHCGMLHCRHLNERLEFGMESVAVLSHSFISSKGSIIPCRTAIVDLGLQSQDPGLTPDGAKCGENKMCINQKCLSVMDLRIDGKAMDCPNSCNGNGICNSVGQCHCNKGFAPPLCVEPGVGGSLVSGPASDPNEGNSFSRILFVFFLGVCPVCGLFAIFIYYYKQNQFNWIITRKAVPKLSTPKQLSPKMSMSSGPSGGVGSASSPNSPDDMNSALLRPVTTPTAITNSQSEAENNNMFGKFKGFTLKPLPDPGRSSFTTGNIAFVHPVSKESTGDITPNRAAPLPPKINGKQVQTVQPINVNRSNTQMKAVKPLVHRPNKSLDKTSDAPALPPLNPGAHPRPIISNPILEASTCSAKELQSPLRNNTLPSVIVRPAPTLPPHPNPQPTENPFASCEVLINPVSTEKVPSTKNGTFKRLASLLKKEERGTEVVPKVIDKEKLKNIQISAPIPIVDDTTDEENENEKIMRTQSMREPQKVVKRQPNLTSFGSMRQPPPKRPASIVDRPTAPPPRPPAPLTVGTSLKTPMTKVPSVENEYDDCEAVEAPLAHISEESSPSSPTDNIYSVIEEPPPQSHLSPQQNPPVLGGSTESMGLLGEIVNEIENRKFDSIYIASTLKRGKQAPKKNDTDKDSDEYSNVKSNSSTTSSSYLRPSAIQPTRTAPIATPELYSVPNSVQLSSFKKAPTEAKPPQNAQKRLNPTLISGISQKANERVTPTSTGLSRTVTPPSLSTNAKSKLVVGTKKPETNVPLKTEKPKPSTKPTIPQKSRQNSIEKPTISSAARPNNIRQNSFENKSKFSSSTNSGVAATPNAISSTNKLLSAAARPEGKTSKVQSLQQKFENGS